MPATAARIDRLRLQLGKVEADRLIRRAMQGEPGCFFSWENCKTFGAQDTRVTSVVGWDDCGIPRRTEPAWMLDAAQFAESVGIEVQINDLQDVDEARARAATLRDILERHKHG